MTSGCFLWLLFLVVVFTCFPSLSCVGGGLLDAYVIMGVVGFPAYPYSVLRESKAHCFGRRPKALPAISRLSKVSIQREWVPKKSVHAVEVNPGATASGPSVFSSHSSVNHIQRD